jgi:uncharacterized membrane protein
MRVEPNAAWKSRQILNLMVWRSNRPTRTKKISMITFIQVVCLLMLISALLVKKTSYQEYGVAGMLISLVASLILTIYLLFK